MYDFTKLVAIRHGQSVGGSLGLILGQVDSPLTEHGLCQVKKIVPSVKKIVGSEDFVIVSSFLKRACQTAEVIADGLKCDFVKTNFFMERNLGMLQGKSKRYLMKNFSDWFDSDGVLLNSDVVPDIELERDFKSRMLAGVLYLESDFSNKKVILVTHGGVIRFLYSYIEAVDLTGMYKKKIIKNAQICTFKKKPEN